MSNRWKNELSRAKEILEGEKKDQSNSEPLTEKEQSGRLETTPKQPLVISAAEIEKAIERFKRDISQRTVSDAVRRNLTFGTCFLLDDDQMFALRNEISENFKIHPSEIILVGSAKLGFSIKPKRRYKQFHDGSDLDVAIVSPTLFEQLWQEVFLYSNTNYYWRESQEAADFRRYLLRGWIRPDLMPFGESFKASQHWFDFFNELTSQQRYGPYPVKAGVYRNWLFFEQYQSICISQCKQELELGKSEGTTQ
jgi:hypothetical protein